MAESNPTEIRFTEEDFEDEEYDFKLPNKGRAVVINNIRFSDGKHRPASIRDGERIKQALLKEIKFNEEDVKYEENLTRDDLYSLLREYAAMDYSNHAMFLCVIMTHGNEYIQTNRDKVHLLEDVIFGCDNLPIGLSLLTELFHHQNCPTLKGKPKIFIIQACRGNKISEAVELGKVMKEAYKQPLVSGAHARPPPREVPVYTDFLLAYATQPGFVSFKDTYPEPYEDWNNSWFIEALCKRIHEVYESKQEIDLAALLLDTSRHVAFAKRSYNNLPHLDNKKEMPWVASRLTKKVMLSTGPSGEQHTGCVLS